MSTTAMGTVAIPEVALEHATSLAEADAAVAEVRTRAHAWRALPVSERVELLDELLGCTRNAAAQWVEVECERKGIDPRNDLAGEEWFLGPAFVLRNLRLLRNTLETVRREGLPRLPGPVRTRPDGRVTARVFPTDRYDRITSMGCTADVWLPDGIRADEVGEHLAATYRGRGPGVDRVCLVLGAGNVSSIAPNDTLYKLFAEDQVVLLKLNPMTAALAEVLTEAMHPLVAGGWLRIVVGGADLGAHLAGHPGIDTIHLTGSDKTYEAVVFGPGETGRANKAAGRRVTDKPVSAELGCVTPLVVVPGAWSNRELRYHARQVASSLVYNAGFNCISTRLVVTHAGWPQRDAFLEAVRAVLRACPDRLPFYPGACARYQDVLAAHPEAERFGRVGDDAVPWTLITGVDPARDDEPVLGIDPFAAVMAEVPLEAASPTAYADAAVELCNERVWGTLGVSVLVHPSARKDPVLAAAADRAIARLRYGTVAVNVWCGKGYAVVSPPWGAYPGHTPDDIQSGTGFVHNTYLFDEPEKTVVRVPFTAVPDPPWFITFGRRRAVLQQNAWLEANPSPGLLPKLLWNAMRG
jgi:acyl-CoA reductase-like NAD-dependent aldehyde dehydrogenase